MLIRINGGLGNQLFQYALGETLRIKYGKKVQYETFSYIRDKKRVCQLEQFHIRGLGNTRKAFMMIWYLFARISLLTGNVSKIDPIFKIFREDDCSCFGEDELSRYYYWVGYWQNEKNFLDIKGELQTQFMCKCEFPKSKEILEVIKRAESVVIHVRRGDYLQGSNQDIYANCDLQYYKAAMQLIKQKVDNPVFFVFSNDIEWCKEHLQEEHIHFVDDKYSESDINDFELMRSCKHFIIANSTFSWWASWLADNTNKIVIAPKVWYLDSKMNEQIGKELLSNTIRV